MINQSENGANAGNLSIGETTKALSNTNELLADGIGEMFRAEVAMTKALSKMSKNATSPELKKALAEHVSMNEVQTERLQKIIEILGIPAGAKHTVEMENMIREAEEVIASFDKGPVRDEEIISSGQKLVNFEIAAYGSLQLIAETFGLKKVLSLIEKTLEEEKKSYYKFSELAMITAD